MFEICIKFVKMFVFGVLRRFCLFSSGYFDHYCPPLQCWTIVVNALSEDFQMTVNLKSLRSASDPHLSML